MINSLGALPMIQLLFGRSMAMFAGDLVGIKGSSRRDRGLAGCSKYERHQGVKERARRLGRLPQNP